MVTPRIAFAIAMAIILAGGSAHAQTTTDERAWSFNASALTYVVPDSQNYVQPTVTADHGAFHLEARYNYENLHTGSAWVGYNFNGGKKLTWEVTPMLGGVFGDTAGVAPGFKGSLNWWKLELYGEGEYLIDAGDSSNSFAYEWSEFTPGARGLVAVRHGHAANAGLQIRPLDPAWRARGRLPEASEADRIFLQPGRGQALVRLRRRSALLRPGRRPRRQRWL